MDNSFLDRLRAFGDTDAVIFQNVRHSYAELTRRIQVWREFLDDQNVRAGDVVVLEGPASPDACAGLLALVERKAIVVPLTPLPDAKRTEFHEVAQVETVITVGSDAGTTYTRTGRTAEHPLYTRLREAGTPGLVLFSSGTTGRSKATVLDFDKVLSRYGA